MQPQEPSTGVEAPRYRQQLPADTQDPTVHLLPCGSQFRNQVEHPRPQRVVGSVKGGNHERGDVPAGSDDRPVGVGHGVRVGLHGRADEADAARVRGRGEVVGDADRDGGGGRPGPARRVFVPGSGRAVLVGSRAMRRIVRTDTPGSAAIRSCGTAAASSNLTSRRFSYPYTFSSRSRESSRGLPAREDTTERLESGLTEPARVYGIWAVRISGTDTRVRQFVRT